MKLRTVLGSWLILAAGASGAAIYAGRTLHQAKPAQAEMTVVPVGSGFSSGTAHSRFGNRRNLLSGIASWYGDVFDGHRTANGEIFDQGAMTACHRTLPFGTLVRVINLRNRHSVVVRINDRGVLTPERLIDLSSAAAQKLGMLERGTAPVRLEIVSGGDPGPSVRQPG